MPTEGVAVCERIDNFSSVEELLHISPDGTESVHGVPTLEELVDLMPSVEELVLSVETKTYRQVRDLKIDSRGDRVTVTGQSRTYYIKQLVTHAILDAAPTAHLDNRIAVHAGC